MDRPPEITWSDVHDHLIRELQIEPEWVVAADRSLVWQPHIVPIRVEAVHEGRFGDGDSYLVVRAWADVARCDGDEGLGLAEIGNSMFPLGSFHWADGTLVAGCGVTLNRTSHTNLSLLHNAVLALATCADELVGYASDGTLPPLTEEAQALGRRTAPDELLGIFAPEGYSLPGQERFVQQWPNARESLRDLMAQQGFQAGHRADDIDFYDMRGMGVGVGFEESERYGAGLRVLAVVATLGPEMPYLDFLNDGNGLLFEGGAHIGRFRWSHQPGQPFAAATVNAFLPHPYVGRFAADPDDLAAAAFNAMAQVRATGASVAAGSQG